MPRFFQLLLLLGLFSTSVSAQRPVYTRQNADKALARTAHRWVKSGQWRQGFTAARPDKSVNEVDFYEQYQRNPEQWQALFRWLATTDLTAIPKGKHPIEGTTLVASVEDSHNEPLAKRRSESHYQHIDFQYVVSGTECFGIIDHTTSTPNCQWRPDVIHYDYDQSRMRLLTSRPDRFFIFFPDDWHIAKVNNATDDQQIRVIVIKVDYKAE